MRRTFVLRGDALVEKQDEQPIGRGLTVISDIAPFRTQDGAAITSRMDLREYEKRNGVRQVGNDFASHTAQLRQRVYGER